METARRKIAEVDAACWWRKRMFSRRKDRSSRPRRLSASFRRTGHKRELQKRNPASSRSVTSKSLRCCKRAVKARLIPQRLRNNPRRSASLLFSHGKGERRGGAREAQVDLDKTSIRAGVDGAWSSSRAHGRYRQSHDTVAGVLIPDGAGQPFRRIWTIEAQS